VTGLLLLLMMLSAACGLLLSFAAQVVSFTSVQLGDFGLFPALWWGIFPTFAAVIFIGILEKKRKMPGRSDDEIDHWELVLAGCPRFMKWMFWACFAYAWVIGMVLAVLNTHDPSTIWRGSSAFWMMFYAMGLAVFAAAWLRRRASRQQR
jgi:hypothetical protein